MKTSRTCHRRAFTLVELVVVLTILGIVSTICVRTLNLLFEADSRSASSAIKLLNCERLADQFRTDVHKAITAVVNQEENKLLLKHSDASTVSYLAEGARLIRQVTGHTRYSPQDVFDIDGATYQFQIENSLVRLIIKNSESTNGQTHRTDLMEDSQPERFTIIASLGEEPAVRSVNTVSTDSEEASDAE